MSEPGSSGTLADRNGHEIQGICVVGLVYVALADVIVVPTHHRKFLNNEPDRQSGEGLIDTRGVWHARGG